MLSLILPFLCFGLSMQQLTTENSEKPATATGNDDFGYLSADEFRRRCEQDDPLGMISGAITDGQITASSTFSTRNAWDDGVESSCHPSQARLYRPNGFSWCAKFQATSEWIQVDLGVAALITGIMTQGRGANEQWISSFMISYSDDGNNWRYVMDQYGRQKIFEGNSDAFSVKHNYLDEPLIARYVKIHVYTWNNHPSLRFELIGCQPCKQLLGIPPYARYTASTSRGARVKRSCTPDNGHYLSNKAWCPLRNMPNQWFQIDVGPPTLVTGLVIKGRGDSKWAEYVTKFKVSYSNDTRLWFFYKDATPLDPRVFEGNDPEVLERIHYLARPFMARYVRIHPLQWHQRIAMRVGLLGCRQVGKCQEGFFKINDHSSCVANLAYKKSAFISSDGNKHTKRHSGYYNDYLSTSVDDADEMAQRAVDGFTGLEEEEVLRNSSEVQYNRYMRHAAASAQDMQGDDPRISPEQLGRAQTHQCAVLQSRYPYDINPTLFVNLRERTEINGVVIYTAGEGNTSASKRLITRSLPDANYDSSSSRDLDALVVYVEDSPRESNGKPGPNARICGKVSKANNAIFKQKIHIPCVGADMLGRYVYVEAQGKSNKHLPRFSAMLCEIMVY